MCLQILKRIKLEINSRNFREISKYLEIKQIFKNKLFKEAITHTYTHISKLIKCS